MTAEYHERRIWWQEEVDRRVRVGGWEPVVSWHGVHVAGLDAERKRAIAAGIEHAIEQAISAERDGCARVADNYAAHMKGVHYMAVATAEHVAAKIREARA